MCYKSEKEGSSATCYLCNTALKVFIGILIWLANVNVNLIQTVFLVICFHHLEMMGGRCEKQIFLIIILFYSPLAGPVAVSAAVLISRAENLSGRTVYDSSFA